MTGGWTGKLLRVNLSTGEHAVETVPDEWQRQYLGGRGLAAKYLYEEMDPTADPLGPDNKLILATGPMTGTATPTGARYMVVTKGPLTNAITTSNSGGHFGPALKFAGYDLLIVEGQSPRPVVLFLHNGNVKLLDAAKYWGKTTSETEDGLRANLGVPDLRVAGIGPAGENLVRFACIINDKHRAAGRSGVGAVMGSKKLKAIAISAKGSIPIAEPANYFDATWKMKQVLEDSPGRQGLTELGTIPTMDLTNEFGGLPTRNFQQGQFEQAEALNGNTLKDTRLVANKACFACTIACGRVVRLGDGADKYAVNTHPRNWNVAGEGPEYENAWALGADIGVGDLDAVIKANLLCNDLGMDPISMGATLAAAMEMYEKGFLRREQIGMECNFGSGDVLIRLTEATAYREGFGDELAEGAKRMTEKFGHPEFFMGVKGQEFPAYDPRGFQGMGVAYATCNRGACHLRAWTPGPETSGEMPAHTPEGKGQWVAAEQNSTTVQDATGMCLFLGAGGVTLDHTLPALNAATGQSWSADDLLRIGERIWNLERLYNNRAGMTRADDSLPKRLLEEAHSAGPSQGVVVHLDQMLDDYYDARGWSREGEPSPAKLAELSLG